MTQLAKNLQRAIEQDRAKLDKLNEESRKLTDKIRMAESLLAMEMGEEYRGGNDSAGVTRREALPTISITERIVEIVAEFGNKGASSKEIIAALRKEGRVMHRIYPYIAIGKLKKAGKICERSGEEGRFYSPKLKMFVA
jgi:hypothetical protein